MSCAKNTRHFFANHLPYCTVYYNYNLKTKKYEIQNPTLIPCVVRWG